MEAKERARPRRAAAAAAVRGFKDDSGSESAGDDDDADEEDGEAEEDGDGDYGTERQAKVYADGEADDYAAVRRTRALMRHLCAIPANASCVAMQAAAIERVLGVRRLPDGSVDYCVKLKERSYREAMWRSGVWMTRFAPTKLRGYRGRAARDGMDDGTVAAGVAHDAALAAAAQGLATDEGEPEPEEPPPADGSAAPTYIGADVYYPAAYCHIDRVIASHEPVSAFNEPKQYLVKWRGLGYASATWEPVTALSSPADTAAVARFEAIMAPHRRAPAEAKLPAEGTLVAPPQFKPGCTLRDYQCVSFDWMVRNMRRKRNVILGDEMGLGTFSRGSPLRYLCMSYMLPCISDSQGKRRRALLCWSMPAWRARARSW